MKNALILLVITCASIGVGIWVSKDLQVHYFSEEYYFVQNLDPKNEKDAEPLRERINQLIQKTIPVRYLPNPDKFQCFKIISEAVFFCSADTYRKHVAEYIQKLLQETIPQEIGWVSQEDTAQKLAIAKDEISNDKKLILEQTKLLEKLKQQSSKFQQEEKKITKTNDLYRNLDLYQKKIEIFKSILTQPLGEDVKGAYQTRLEETQQNMNSLQQEYETFHAKNKKVAEVTDQQETLQQEIKQLKEKIEKTTTDISFLKETLSRPNGIGKVADVHDLQLIPDESKSKSGFQQNDTNVVWFSIVTFFLLSNLLFRFTPTSLIPFEEDPTMTEALIK